MESSLAVHAKTLFLSIFKNYLNYITIFGCPQNFEGFVVTFLVCYNIIEILIKKRVSIHVTSFGSVKHPNVVLSNVIIQKSFITVSKSVEVFYTKCGLLSKNVERVDIILLHKWVYESNIIIYILTKC